MRNPYVDYLRGISILIVLLIHFMIFPATFPGFSVIERLAAGGYCGVTMFFVVSGYLITSRTLMRHGTLGAVSAREFYAMRAARIAPCLLLSLVLLVGLNATGYVAFTSSDVWTGVLCGDLPVQHLPRESRRQDGDPGLGRALVPGRRGGVCGVSLKYTPLKRTLYVCILLSIIIINGPWYRHDYYSNEGNYSCIFMYLGNFDAIAIGCLTAIVSARHSIRSGRVAAWVAAGATLFVIGSIISFPIYAHFVIGPACVAWGAGIYLFAVHGRMSRPRTPWPLRPALEFSGFLRSRPAL